MLTTIAENVAAAHAQSRKSGFWNHGKGCQHAGCGEIIPGEQIADIPNGREPDVACSSAFMHEHAHGGPEAAGLAPCACVNLSLDMKVVLLHSELSEALEEFRLGEAKHGGPFGVLLYLCMRCGEQRHTSAIIHCATVHPPTKPVGLMSELADVCIRAYDLTGHLEAQDRLVHWYNEEQGYIEHASRRPRPPGMPHTFASVLRAAHSGVAIIGDELEDLRDLVLPSGRASSGMASARDRAREAAIHGLALLLHDCEEVAKLVGAAGGALDETIRIKMKFNASREPMHGKVC